MNLFHDHIFILDLHNTLYDEVLEYGGALSAAMACFFDQARAQNIELNETAFYAQLSAAHAQAGSDWDNDVWHHIPALQKLDNLDKIIIQAIQRRQSASETLTKRYAYQDTLKSLHALKKAGATLVLATEATANAAADAVRWLGLEGVIDAVYSWPYTKPYQKLEKTQHYFFPAHPDNKMLSLQKPHPLILGAILLDIAKAARSIPADITNADVYNLTRDKNIDVSALIAKTDKPQAIEAVRAIQTRLALKDTPYKPALQALWQRCFYVGDSFFKDGFLARNAGLPFIQAHYGKKVDDPKIFEKAKETLYKATGWDSFLLQLTQDASKLPALTDKIKPYFICRESLQDFIDRQ